MNSLTDINDFVKTQELLETDTEVLYEVYEKKAPELKYTLKVYKKIPEDYSSLLDFLYKTNSAHPLSLNLNAFPRLFSSFKCRDKVDNSKVCDCVLLEHVPSYLRILYQKDFMNKTGSFIRIYRYYQSFIDFLGYLEISGLFHGNLCPEVIGVTNEKALKFMELENLNYGMGNLNNSKLLNKDLRSPYLAPELKKALFEGKNLSFNGNKIDVFAMGAILLELGGEAIEEGVSLKELEEMIEEKLKNFKAKFEKAVPFNYIEMFGRFMKILELSLSIDPKNRPSPLELLKKSMQFINKNYVLSFLKIIEENMGKEDLFESVKSFERFEIQSLAINKIQWKIIGIGSQGFLIQSPDGKIGENLNSIELINALNFELFLPDPKKAIEIKDLLKNIQEIIENMIINKRIEPIDSLTLQASPQKSLCQTVPERNYFYNVLFKKGEMEIPRGLRYFIGHETNFWNGIPNEIVSLLLTSLEFCPELASLRLCLGSWLDLTAPGLKRLIEAFSKISLRKLRNLEFGLYAHSADNVSINEIASLILKGLQIMDNHNMESLTFFVFTNSPQDASLSTLADIIQFSPKIKDLNIHLRQLTKSSNIYKFEDKLTIPFLSALTSLKLGISSTIEPYIEDLLLARLFNKLTKGLSTNIVLNSLGIYLLTWGEIDKGFYALQDLLKERTMALDLYFYGKGPEKANEQELQGKFKEATKKTRINMLHFELSGKTLKSNSPTIKE